jgi:hypothetical protein
MRGGNMRGALLWMRVCMRKHVRTEFWTRSAAREANADVPRIRTTRIAVR